MIAGARAAARPGRPAAAPAAARAPGRPAAAGGSGAPPARAAALPLACAPGRGRLGPRRRRSAALGRLACEFILEPADYRRLDRRGRRPNKLAHLLELGHHGLALDAELLREFVNPDLRHCAPSTRPGLSGPVSRSGQRVLRPASACAVHRRMLIGRSSQVSLLSFQCLRPAVHCRLAQPVLAADSPARYSATLPSGSAAGRRRARGKRLAALGSFQACQARVQVCTPARQPPGNIGNDLVSRRPPRGSSRAWPRATPHPIQVRVGAPALPVPAYRAFAPAPPAVAPVTRPARRRRGPALASTSGRVGTPAHAVPRRPVSARISMRQPVSRAARRAFCPSLPIASESW